mgnify:CR=1 FL=1
MLAYRKSNLGISVLNKNKKKIAMNDWNKKKISQIELKAEAITIAVEMESSSGNGKILW